MSNKRLNATITIGGAISGSLKAALGSARSGVDAIGSAVTQLTARQKELNRTIADQEKLGRNGSALKVQYAQQELGIIGKQIAALKQKQALEQRITAGHAANAAQRTELRGQVLGTVAAGLAATAPIRAAVNFESAMLGIAKQVQGAKDDAGNLTPVYYEMAKAIQALGRELPVPTNEIASMVTAAARMGIAKEDLLDFTRTAAVMSTAFEMPAAELADNMGKIAGIFKIPMKEINGLGDAINYLDDNAISKGSDIIKVLQGDLAGAASTMGISAKNAAALASTFLTLGESAERADTAASGMLRQLQIAKMNPKKFQVGVQMIGMTAEGLQKGMIADGQGTILKVLDRIKALPQEKQMEAVTRLFGKDWGGAIAKLAGGVEEYRRQLELANGPKAAGSMSREFQSRMQTTAAKWETLKNVMTEFAVVTGEVMLPALKSVVDSLKPVIGGMSDMKREHPAATKAIMGTVFALVGMKVASLGAKYAWTLAKDAWLVGTRVAQGLGTALTWLSARVLPVVLTALRPVVLAFALAGAPIWAVVAAVAAVAAAGVLVYKYWEPLKAFFGGFFEGIASALAPIGQGITDAFAPVTSVLGPVVMPILRTIGEWVMEAVGWFGQLFTPIEKASTTTVAFGEAGKVCGAVVGAAFKLMLAPVIAVLDALKWINDNIGGVIAKVSQIGGAVGGAAKGFLIKLGGPNGGGVPAPDGSYTFPDGSISPGGGPLPAVPPLAPGRTGANVTSTQQNTFNITQQPGQDGKALADEVARHLARSQAVNRRGALPDGAGTQ